MSIDAFGQPVLECQGCGKVLRELTHEEARKVADRPYDFVKFCWGCRKDGLHLEWWLT